MSSVRSSDPRECKRLQEGGTGATGGRGRPRSRWAASGPGNDTLADTTVAERLSFELLPEGVPYGLGILQIGPWLGHEGEAIGWEALALHDPDTGTSIAMAANGCGGLFGGFLDVLGSLDPDTMEGLST